MDAKKLVKRLQAGKSSFDEALPELEPDDMWGQPLAEALARVATPEQARTLLDVIHARDNPWPGVLYVTGRELLNRGLAAEVFDYPWTLTQLIGFGEAVVEPAAFEVVLEHFAARLDRVIASHEEADALTMLGAKHFIANLSARNQAALLSWLEPRVKAENEAGEYEELDYAYGQVDPQVELAQCFALTGRHHDAATWLEARDAVWPQMMHGTELLDLAVICDALGSELRAEWWPRLRDWARATDRSGYGDEGESLEMEWLVRTISPPEADAPAELVALMSAAPGQRLAPILANGSPVVRDAARSYLVTLLGHAVANLVEGRGQRNRHIRAICSAACTLDAVATDLSATETKAVGEAARGWAEWFSGYEPHGDWLPHCTTAIAFSGSFRDEIEPAAVRLRANEELKTCDGWERL